MVWVSFIENKDRRGLLILLKNVTTSRSDYINVLRDFLPVHSGIRELEYFMRDNAPCHQSEIVQNFLNDSGINVLEWPRSSPHLSPIKTHGTS